MYTFSLFYRINRTKFCERFKEACDNSNGIDVSELEDKKKNRDIIHFETNVSSQLTFILVVYSVVVCEFYHREVNDGN